MGIGRSSASGLERGLVGMSGLLVKWGVDLRKGRVGGCDPELLGTTQRMGVDCD